MSRSGYSDDCDGWALIRWRGAVQAAIRGRRGQAMLRELVQALDALPEKRLARDALSTDDGEYCTLGALGRARGLDLAAIDPDDREAVASAFGVAEAMAAEIMFLNDDEIEDFTYVNFEVVGPLRPWERRVQLRRAYNPRAAEVRWSRMRAWAVANLSKQDTPA